MALFTQEQEEIINGSSLAKKVINPLRNELSEDIDFNEYISSAALNKGKYL
jgi:hypothetical protein